MQTKNNFLNIFIFVSVAVVMVIVAENFYKRHMNAAFVNYLETDQKGYNQAFPEYDYEKFMKEIDGYTDGTDLNQKRSVIYALEEFMRRKEYRPSHSVTRLISRSHDEEILFVALRYLSKSEDPAAISAIETISISAPTLVRDEANRTLSVLKTLSQNSDQKAS